jgi:RNA polymerase sigma-70 factor (sigma-E family)
MLRSGPEVVAMDDVDESFAAMFRVEYARTVRSVQAMLGDVARAEDVAQDAFVALHHRWSEVSKYDQPGAWVRRVCFRKALRVMHRDQVRARLEQLLHLGVVVPDPSSGVVDRRALAVAVSALPARQRAAVVLHYYEDLTVAEVADAIGCSPGTVKVHLHRARQTLAAAVKGVTSDA